MKPVILARRLEPAFPNIAKALIDGRYGDMFSTVKAVFGLSPHAFEVDCLVAYRRATREQLNALSTIERELSQDASNAPA